jgi:hypothetical protein
MTSPVFYQIFMDTQCDAKMITISYTIGRYARFRENNSFITSSIGYVKIGITLSIHSNFY